MYKLDMKHYFACGLLLLIALGCGSKDNTVVTGGKDGSWSATTSKGEELQVSKDGMTMKNEKGEVSSLGVSDVSESELGLPFYPGSTSIEGRDMKVNADGKQIFVSARMSSDTPTKVVEFYKDKVKDSQATTAEKFGSVAGKLEDGRIVNVMAMVKDSGGTEVQVSVTREPKK
jgi:hypothetical protein